MDKHTAQLWGTIMPCVTICVLAIITLLFFKIPCCCQCKCDCKSGNLRVKQVDAHVIGTNTVMCAGRTLTNTWRESVCISVTNKVDVP